MSVKIFIERKFEKAPLPENFKVINELRRVALQQQGYVTGETLVNFEDNHIVVLSTWVSLDDWRVWSNSRERTELENELIPYMKGPVKIRQFIAGADYKKKMFV